MSEIQTAVGKVETPSFRNKRRNRSTLHRRWAALAGVVSVAAVDIVLHTASRYTVQYAVHDMNEMP